MAKIKFENRSVEDEIIDEEVKNMAKATAKESLGVIIDHDLIDKNVIAMRMVQDAAIRLYAKKNHDYGDAFNKGCDALGYLYAFSRIWDKVNRFQNLASKMASNEYTDIRVKDEKLEDTIADLANYCQMFLVWYKKVTDNKND